MTLWFSRYVCGSLCTVVEDTIDHVRRSGGHLLSQGGGTYKDSRRCSVGLYAFWERLSARQN